MQSKKVISVAGLGVVLIIVALVVMLAIVPGMKKWPSDVDEYRYYEGTLNSMLNADALAKMDLANVFIKDEPVSISRHYTVEETSGDKMLVREVIDVQGSEGQSIIGSDKLWPLDRKDLNIIPNFTDREGVQQGEGLIISFPMDSEKEDQIRWVSDLQTTAPLKYLGEEKHAGINTYVLESTVPGGEITDPEVLAALPASLPKAIFTMLTKAVPLTPEAKAALATFDLSILPDPVPLKYVYQYYAKYWVEPELGVNVDIERSETRLVALEVGGNLLPLTPVFDIQYSQTDESVAEAVSDAKDKKDDLKLYGSTIPYILIALGVLLIILAVYFGKRGCCKQNS